MIIPLHRIGFIFILAIASACLGQYYTPGSSWFSLERWEEDYSGLKNQTTPHDFFDPIKYIPLNRAGDSYLSFGGQMRYRYDYFNNPTFGPGVNDEDGFHLQR